MHKLNWKKEPAIKGINFNCKRLGSNPDFFPQDGKIAAGFGYGFLQRNGLRVWIGQYNYDQDIDDWMSWKYAERLAAKDPDQDWRIIVHGPLSTRVYQRHDNGVWPLIEQDPVIWL